MESTDRGFWRKANLVAMIWENQSVSSRFVEKVCELLWGKTQQEHLLQKLGLDALVKGSRDITNQVGDSGSGKAGTDEV